MDMGFDHSCLPFGGASGTDAQGEERPLDWESLHARLVATHDLLRSDARDAVPAASFAPDAARTLATYGLDKQAVNPTGLTLGKPDGGIDEGVGRAPMPADRGWE